MVRRGFFLFQVLVLVGPAVAAAGCSEGVARSASAAPVDGAAGGDDEALTAGCKFRHTTGAYGFACSGSQNLGQGPVPVAAVGVLAGDGKGALSGHGTLNTPLGSLPWRFSGSETVAADCFGRVNYDGNEIESPAGSGAWIKLPPALFDFAAVDDAAEILGSAIAPGGLGDDVPRLTCRLVRIARRR